MDRIFAHVQREILADRAGVSLFRVRSAHDFAILGNRVLAFENLHNHRASAHLVDEFAKEGALFVDGVKSLSLTAGHVDTLLCDDAQASGLDLGIDRTGQVAAGGVGLDDRKSVLNGHGAQKSCLGRRWAAYSGGPRHGQDRVL